MGVDEQWLTRAKALTKWIKGVLFINNSLLKELIRDINNEYGFKDAEEEFASGQPDEI
jgi:hypothetical protein